MRTRKKSVGWLFDAIITILHSRVKISFVLLANKYWTRKTSRRIHRNFTSEKFMWNFSSSFFFFVCNVKRLWKKILILSSDLTNKSGSLGPESNLSLRMVKFCVETGQPTGTFILRCSSVLFSPLVANKLGTLAPNPNFVREKKRRHYETWNLLDNLSNDDISDLISYCLANFAAAKICSFHSWLFESFSTKKKRQRQKNRTLLTLWKRKVGESWWSCFN